MTKDMTICTGCQFNNPKGMKFCGACGSALSCHCHECGFLNPTDFKYCGKCGQGLNNQSKVDDSTVLRESVESKLEENLSTASNIRN